MSESWRSDVVPEIRWAITMDGLAVHYGAGVPDGHAIAWHVPGHDAYVIVPEIVAPIVRAAHTAYWRLRLWHADARWHWCMFRLKHRWAR